MAEGGSKYSLSGGHEEFFEWQCKICEDDGMPKEATAYCTTCCDCFCSTCAKFHIKFTRSKHQVLGEKEKADWGRSESKGETVIFCSDHHGQQVSMYCAEHDNLCCPVCAVLKHSDSCKPKMSYIPDVAKGLKEEAYYKAVIADNDNLISSITALAKVRTNLQAKLKASRDECTRRIETFHKKLAKHLHKLKEESIAEMNKSHDEMVQNVEEDIKACRKLEQELQDIKEQLSPSVSVNESILFVRMKNGQKRLPNYEDLITNLAALERKTFEFIQSDSYSKSVCSARTLGECIGVTQTPKKPHAPMPVMEAKDQCPICKGNINKPRTLDCGHKFCTGCIEKSFKCPTCGEVCGVLTGQLIIESESPVTDKLATELKNMLKNVSNISIKGQQLEIDPNQLLFLLIKNYYRIGTDVDRAVKILKDKIQPNLVALVVIHINEPRALPSVMTKDVLFDDKYNRYGLIVDMAFIDGQYYACEMNTSGRTQLEEFIQKHSNEKVMKVKKNAVPLPVDVQLFIQPDLRDVYDRLGEKLNFEDPVVPTDALQKLERTRPWIVVCHEGHFIQQEIQNVADEFANPKLLLVLHQNEDKKNSAWSANLLTYQLPRDRLEHFINKELAEDKDIKKFRSMIVAGRTEKQASAAKKFKSQCPLS